VFTGTIPPVELITNVLMPQAICFDMYIHRQRKKKDPGLNIATLFRILLSNRYLLYLISDSLLLFDAFCSRIVKQQYAWIIAKAPSS
jgi:hypothetical protein